MTTHEPREDHELADLLDAIAGDCDAGEDNDWEAHEWQDVAADLRRAASALRRPSPVAESTPSPDMEELARGLEQLDFAHGSGGLLLWITPNFRDRVVTALRTANTGRAEVLEEAARAAYVTCAKTRHVTLGRACETAIRALSSPPVTIAPDGPSEDDKLYLAQEVAWSTPTDATAVEAEREWQTWESAPADGTVILAYRPDAGVFTAHYVEEDAHIATPMNPPEGDCYWFTTGGEDLTQDLPTHWRFLPTPPETSR
jgi:hypothetical protein